MFLDIDIVEVIVIEDLFMGVCVGFVFGVLIFVVLYIVLFDGFGVYELWLMFDGCGSVDFVDLY